MAKSSKSGKKANKTVVSGGMIFVIVAIVLIIACFFTYISGVLPRTLTGVSITETLADGTTRTVKNFNVLETNMHFKEVFDTYSNYGMVSQDTLDDVYDTTTGETYRDWLLKEAASQMRTLALVERAAKGSDYMQYSKAYDYSMGQLASLDSIAQIYGFQSAQQYMARMYGTGMTTRTYAEYASREVLVTEYGYYLKQFDPSIVPTDEQIQAKFNDNNNVYCLYDFNRFYVQAEKDEDGNVIGLDAAIAAAHVIANATKDSATFRQAVIDYLDAKGDEESLASYADGADPTLCTGYTNTTIAYMDSDVQAFLYGDSKSGDVQVIETTGGAYVVYIVDKRLDDTKVVNYRVMTLSNEAANKTDATPEEIAQGAQALVNEVATYAPSGLDPLAFYNVVKEHTTDTNGMLDGGYNSGARPESFVSSDEENPLDVATVQAGMWLFEEGRQAGDVKAFISDDQKTVYVYYFESSAPAWYESVRTDLITQNFNTWNANLESNDPHYVVNAGLVKYLIY